MQNADAFVPQDEILNYISHWIPLKSDIDLDDSENIDNMVMLGTLSEADECFKKKLYIFEFEVTYKVLYNFLCDVYNFMNTYNEDTDEYTSLKAHEYRKNLYD